MLVRSDPEIQKKKGNVIHVEIIMRDFLDSSGRFLRIPKILIYVKIILGLMLFGVYP